MTAKTPGLLADLDRAGKLVSGYFNACGRERDLPPTSLGLSYDTLVPEARKRLVCLACGGQDLTVMLELYPSGVAAIRRRHQGT